MKLQNRNRPGPIPQSHSQDYFQLPDKTAVALRNDRKTARLSTISGARMPKTTLFRVGPLEGMTPSTKRSGLVGTGRGSFPAAGAPFATALFYQTVAEKFSKLFGSASYWDTLNNGQSQGKGGNDSYGLLSSWITDTCV